MKIFIICSVRGANKEYKHKLEEYVAKLESEGHIVHLPHRDTNQNGTSLGICIQNTIANVNADETHIFYSSTSQGSHFDIGVRFASGKKIKVIESETLTEHKSFQNMLNEWETKNYYFPSLEAVKERISEFSDRKFGTNRPFTAPLHHLKLEVDEAIESGDIKEFADIILLSLDSFRKKFPDLSTNDLMTACLNKIKECETREWNEPDENGVITHKK